MEKKQGVPGSSSPCPGGIVIIGGDDGTFNIMERKSLILLGSLEQCFHLAVCKPQLSIGRDV
jgi:hypothetical protein